MFGRRIKNDSVMTANDKSTSIISFGTHIKGNVETNGSVRLDGSINGNCHAKYRIVLGDKSMIEGSVKAQDAEIAGTVKGDVGWRTRRKDHAAS